MKPFQTERLWLRELTLDDARFVIELLNDPDWIRYIGDKNVRTLEDARAYLKRVPLASYEQHDHGMYLVVRKEDMSPMGFCGLIKREGLEDRDVGFAFLPRYRSHGYAYEAAMACIEDGRSRLGVKRLVAITTQDNAASCALLERLGLRFEKNVQLPNSDEVLRYFGITYA